MRRTLPVLTIALLAASLVGCATDSEETPSETETSSARECVSSGTVSDSVTVSGDFGSAPEVTFEAPLELDETQRTVVSRGDGEVAAYGSVVTVDYTFYNARSGDPIDQTSYEDGGEVAFLLDDTQLLAGLVKTIECSTVGSRVLGVVPSDDAFGDDGLEDYGIEGGDSLLFVVDVLAAATRATGEVQEPVDGFPTVTLAEDGAPSVTIPDDYELPTTSQSAVLIKGDGREVQSTDGVYIQYYGLDAETGEVFDQTWGSTPYGGTASGFITGFTDALVGQTVGSQFIVVIPPSEGYGEESEDNTSELAGKTLIFVVDVLAAISSS